MDRYDVGIIGAGIAGSCLAISLAKAGFKVLIAEQHEYPKHKVCGEFVSSESYDFLCSLGLRLDEWDLPRINQLELTSELGCTVKTPMDMGGFGISRYKLDYELSLLFAEYQIDFLPNTKVVDAKKHLIQTTDFSYPCDLVIAAHGKYKAKFKNHPTSADKTNYIAVKYHIKSEQPANQIALHSFKGGYCGISKVETNRYCLCYLIDSKYLKHYSNSISDMENAHLFKNSKIKEIYEQSEFLWDKPLVISNVQFGLKQLYDEQFIYLGDAASSISPLSGNGMSIAAASAQLLSSLIINKENDLHKVYAQLWRKQFNSRVNKAKILNYIMLNPSIHHRVLQIMNANSYLLKSVINSMQGEKIQIV